MVAESALHPDPVGGDDALRRLQRPRGRVPAVGGRRWSVRWRTSSGRGSPTRSATYGRLELLEKHGKFLHIKPSHLAWADRWFERYGAPAVFFGRMLPIIRTFISLPAGVARMPFWKFSVFTFARLPAVGLRAHLRRPEGGRELDGLEGLAALRRLRGRGAHRPRRRLPRRPLEAQPQPRARRGCAGLAARSNCATRVALGVAPRAHRAAADLLLGPHHARAVAARLALRRARPRAAQGLRGGAARRDGGGAARRACATRWRPPRAASTTAARC